MDNNINRDQNIEKATHMIHGGDVYENDVLWDFSVSTNPCAEALLKAAISGKKDVLDEATFLSKYVDHFLKIKEALFRGVERSTNYPDLKYKSLRAALSVLEGVGEENIICGSGASELFMAIVHAARPQKALVISPCYSGYEYALGAVGCDTLRYELREEDEFEIREDILKMLSADIDIFFLARPNNPTGKTVNRELLEKIIKKCKDNDILLVLDECFYPLTEEGCNNDGNGFLDKGVVIVKAFTKTMATPGLRLGYLLCDDMVFCKKIKSRLPEWNVSSVAQEFGCEAARLLHETDFLKDSVGYIENEKKYLTDELRKKGFRVFESDTNYILVKGRAGISTDLLKDKILVRDCTSFKSLGEEYFRVSVKMHEENKLLIEKL